MGESETARLFCARLIFWRPFDILHLSIKLPLEETIMLKLGKRFFASAALAAVLLSNSVISVAAFDEGMYAPDQISQLTFLKARGLRIRPIDIYNPNGGGLTDAIMRLSIGCTAE